MYKGTFFNVAQCYFFKRSLVEETISENYTPLLQCVDTNSYSLFKPETMACASPVMSNLYI